MSRLSRGCIRCRQRRVRCDQGRPFCQRCIKRNEVCEGYRDEATLIFRHETDKVVEQAKLLPVSLIGARKPARQSRRRNSFAEGEDGRNTPLYTHIGRASPAKNSVGGIEPLNPFPWAKTAPVELQPSAEDQAVERFMGDYVLYPCNETLSPGFLEHLPSLFKEANVEGRYALRLAVRAAGYADLSRDKSDAQLASEALKLYGLSLSALAESLSMPGKAPDDYDLMTVVILDIFEVCALDAVVAS
jgi:hypothetical protein